MPYIEEIAICGKVIEVTRRYSSRFGKKYIPRSCNKNPTKEDMKKVNMKNSFIKLRRIFNTNFKPKDIYVTLTYRKNERPTKEQAKKNIKNFMKRLRRYYKKNNMELKYILVTGYGRNSIHHHLVINSMDARDLTDLWPYGRPSIKYLDDKNQYNDLAKYFIEHHQKNRKEVITTKKWSTSRNLKKPIIIKKVIGRNRYRKEPKAKKGYYIDKNSIVNAIHEITGQPYLFYSMIKLE